MNGETSTSSKACDVHPPSLHSLGSEALGQDTGCCEVRQRRSVLAFRVMASAVSGLGAVAAVLEPMLTFTHYMYNLPQLCR